jgi:hypothetical protein
LLRSWRLQTVHPGLKPLIGGLLEVVWDSIGR